MDLAKIDYDVDKLLKDPNILKRFVDEIGKGVAGEEDTIEAVLLHIFCAWVKNPSMKTHLLVNSESSSGKSFVCNKIRKIFPRECYEYRTKITPEALTYWHNAKYEPEWTWDGKFLYLEDVRDDVINSPTFKIMASEGSTATVVIKQRAIDVEINGSPVIIMTSANASPNAEIINRFGIINLDETPEQTGEIMKKQLKDSILGNRDEYDPIFPEAIKKLMRCEVRLPEWATTLIDYLPKENIRIRRDTPRFIDLIKSSAVLHQKQREFDITSKVVFANEKDYETARSVFKKIEDAGGVHGLTHRLRKCFDVCKEYFKEKEEYFSANEIFQYSPIVSERQWLRILEQLAQRGLLKVDLRKPPEDSRATKPTTTFYPSSSIKIELPPISTLLNDTNDIKDIKDNTDIKDIIET